jgi:hypothetical protein
MQEFAAGADQHGTVVRVNKSMEERASRYARTHPRDKGAPPHWLRCQHVNDNEQRCLKGDGHTDEHTYPVSS